MCSKELVKGNRNVFAIFPSGLVKMIGATWREQNHCFRLIVKFLALTTHSKETKDENKLLMFFTRT